MTDLGQAAAWHQHIAAFVAAADRAGAGTADLPVLRQRLNDQQARLTERFAQIGAPLPALVPTPAAIAAAATSLGDMSATAVGRAVASANATLDAADAILSGATHAGGSPATATPVPVGDPASAALSPVLRNALIYGAYSAAVVGVQLLLFLLLDEQNSLLFAAPLCVLVFPAFAWLAGWLTIGVVAPQQPSSARRRSPRLGAAICAVPDLLLCSGLAILLVLRLFQR